MTYYCQQCYDTKHDLGCRNKPIDMLRICELKSEIDSLKSKLYEVYSSYTESRFFNAASKETFKREYLAIADH
jgi:hypothetical protein